MFPPGWQIDSEKRVDNSACPVLAGVYGRLGELYVVETKAGRKSVEQSSSASLIWTGHPRQRDDAARFQVPLTMEHQKRSDTFWINQPSVLRFEVCWIHRNQPISSCVVFDQRMNDFTCRDGVVLLRPEDSQGYRGSDGVGLSVGAHVRIAKEVNGSIIYHRHIDLKSTSLFVFSTEKTADSFYRFPQAHQQ